MNNYDPVPGRLYRLRMALVKAFDRLCQIPRWRTLDRVLARAVEQKKDWFFVQIGANDGVIYDPIHRFVQASNWRGVLVEPVRSHFDKLKQNYRSNHRLIFENVAISKSRETREFYRIGDDLPFLPEWTKGLGTFDRKVLMSHTWAIPDLERYIVREAVECIAFKDLLEKHRVRKIDLLLIDTEGYDYEILEQIDFEAQAPSVLLYEHQYIERSLRRKMESRLKARGYRLSHHFGNTLAYFPPT